MHLPEKLQQAILFEAEKFKLKDISFAREELTSRYRQPKIGKTAPIASDLERCAYVVARMPATFAVINKILIELKHRVEKFEFKSMLDLGAGPGTAMWAACQNFPEIRNFSLIEQDFSLIELGKRLAESSDNEFVKAAEWKLQKMEDLNEDKQYDLVILSYSLGELPNNAISQLIEACWNLTNGFLVIIEPGTPTGFNLIRSIRDQLIALKAYLVAPCPHANKCPMENKNWCHFDERVERSFLHRRIKGGTLGYEDEKFSYLIVSKKPCRLPESRILRHPQKHSGHMIFELCTSQGIEQRIISKRTPEIYKKARKMEWGSSFEGKENE